ncbi:SPASM domain peptide maturase, grasp-with-spasm system [Chryseobacterium soldanellicola]|uniref:SPASM domain peptide maturase, grasp-with-spasm system n=1 Tax=Chryseobacterium soldanellicola TaxID=311333 RepID=A0A1H0ZPW2_9FLAO|nr:grasp-with-spasm system SPASM domain peptide maturase [Chryseobacterium soldanellicola]SDQ29422.1 SPASM domain peptide maturase, grasp-with-spasm system [Chryseobacterium soldanellicola]
MKTYKLFSNCILVKGFTRSSIIDTQRKEIFLIPNDLYKILNDEKLINFEKLEKEFYDSKQIIKGYRKFLLEKELIFECNQNEVDFFIPIQKGYSTPSSITNMIIDISDSLDPFLNKIKKEIEHLGVVALQLRAFDFQEKIICDFLDLLEEDSRIYDLQIILKYENNIDSKLKKLLRYTRINKILVFGGEINYKDERVIFIQRSISNAKSCGLIDENITYINSDIAHESMNFNSCLHKKISIDKQGNIKNCPSMCQGFGNIKTNTLEEALEHKDFKKYWNLTKDNIEGCKDCEFRHICTDCRAYTERTHINGLEFDTSKPLKCGYDPYTGEWEEWSKNPLKQKAIKHYELENFI